MRPASAFGRRVSATGGACAHGEIPRLWWPRCLAAGSVVPHQPIRRDCRSTVGRGHLRVASYVAPWTGHGGVVTRSHRCAAHRRHRDLRLDGVLLVALDRPTVQRAVDDGDKRAATVLPSFARCRPNCLARRSASRSRPWHSAIWSSRRLASSLRHPWRPSASESAAISTSTVLALLIATMFSMIFGELIPQFLGISVPLRVAERVAPPVRLFSTLVRPLIVILNGSANAVLHALGIEPQEELSAARTPQELASMVRRSAEAGTMEADTARLLTRSLDFGERTAEDVMSPGALPLPRAGRHRSRCGRSGAPHRALALPCARRRLGRRGRGRARQRRSPSRRSDGRMCRSPR